MPHIHDLYDFTTSAFIVHPTEPQLLFLHHKKLQKWLQPGGHIELDEDVLGALEHELVEETGLHPGDYVFIEPADQPREGYRDGERVLPLPFHMNTHKFNDKHKHIDICYLLHSKEAQLTSDPDGASEIAWLTEDQIKQLYDNGQMFTSIYTIASWIFARLPKLIKER